MPIYEYQCNQCGSYLEAVQRITDAALVECPSCHRPALVRLISRAAFVLKGGGWYRDGYAAGSGSANTGSSSEKKSEETANSSVKAETEKKT